MLASIGVSQRDQATDQSSRTEGEKIVSKARQAIGDKTREILSYYYKSKDIASIMGPNDYESSEEISFKSPDMFQVIYSGESKLTGSSKLTRTWNGIKYNSIFVSELSGQRTVRDVTAAENKPISKTVSDVIGKKTTAALSARKADPKNIFIESLWTSIFPLILSHPFEKDIAFNYVGKAKSNDKTANVIDVKPSNGKTYRLLFDSETNHLLMMIVSHKETNDRFVGDVEAKYYYSERKLIGGVLVPTQIKVEKKATPSGQSPVIKFSNIEILDFKLNPTLDDKIFKIK